MGSAARGSIDQTIAAALQELEVASRAEAPEGPLPDLNDPHARIGPLQHVQHYDDPSNAPALAAFLAGRRYVDLDELRERWPGTPRQPESLSDRLIAAGLDPLAIDVGRPDLFGDWSVIRAVVPGLVELSWGSCYLRVASDRAQRLLAGIDYTSAPPHPYG